MIITEAGADDRVTQLLYVTSVMPDAGESQAQLLGSEPAPWLRPGDDGTIGVDPGMIREFFLQDCDESDDRAGARPPDQTIPHSVHAAAAQDCLASRSRRPTSCAPKTSRPSRGQRRRVRAGAGLVEFHAGHHPFLSRPDEFAQSIAAEIDQNGRG